MDQIRIDNLEVYCHHGLLKEENVLGQKFLISLTLETDTRQAGREDDINYSIDYAQVSHFVEGKMKEKNYKLIEAAAEHLAEELLENFSLIQKVRLQIKKPWAPILLPLDTVSVTIEREWKQVYLSVGSNLGDREKYIEDAIEALRKDNKIKDLQVSGLIETKPYGVEDQPKFLNGALALKTLYSPEELLERLHEIEKAGKRERSLRWGPRTIDLDILTYGDEIIQKENLTIPHIEMHKRLFVLEPLRELSPWLLHPVLHRTVEDLYEDLKEESDD
ncbi:MAG: 2-amino-4-hydroxy-6-hydroxymethyldihydropteridine diphosphokinase [Eubacterium sp.]|nr:2-amino-4-hydroxy-6-hydroxymethyldihydropteridine diphosphokinase [Eubacterium sp.]